MIDYNQLPPSSRVWIYQSNRAFSTAESDQIQAQLRQFIQQWQSHGKPVKAWGLLQYNRFVVLVVDESYEAPSGCSIDSSVALIKELEQTYQVDFFDRMNFAYKKDNAVLSANRTDFANLYQNGTINNQTIVFNNLVNTKEDLEEQWEVRLGDSWHARMV
jgi:hypothetical protein